MLNRQVAWTRDLEGSAAPPAGAATAAHKMMAAGSGTAAGGKESAPRPAGVQTMVIAESYQAGCLRGGLQGPPLHK